MKSTLLYIGKRAIIEAMNEVSTFLKILTHVVSGFYNTVHGIKMAACLFMLTYSTLPLDR